MDKHHIDDNEDPENILIEDHHVDDNKAADEKVSEEYYWIKRSIDNAHIPEALKASFISSIGTLFQEIVEKKIHELLVRNGMTGVLFGGIHRRRIYAKNHLTKVLNSRRKICHQKDVFKAPFSSHCFVSTRADLDYKFPTRQCVEDMLTFLSPIFNIRVICTHCDAYNQAGCLVTKLMVSPLLNIYDENVSVSVDFITMCDSKAILLPDFMANCLESPVHEGEPRLTLSPATSFFTREYRAPCASALIFSEVVAGITNLETDILVMSYAQYSKVMREHCRVVDAKLTLDAHYDGYIQTLFTHRLVKMVQDGWEIKNLEFRTVIGRLMMPCGHLWEGDKVYFKTLAHDEHIVVAQCSDCQDEPFHTMFRKFDVISPFS